MRANHVNGVNKAALEGNEMERDLFASNTIQSSSFTKQAFIRTGLHTFAEYKVRFVKEREAASYQLDAIR